MYATVNYATKKEFELAVANPHSHVTLFAPGLGRPKTDGTEFVEGPHYPAPHSWYAQVTMRNGRVISVDR